VRPSSPRAIGPFSVRRPGACWSDNRRLHPDLGGSGSSLTAST
jgi:hypothetical protein